ncbi:hypothetical protein [[Scytonema hofmanni] UTEX B 1581]|nr:hypothetical protein [[Scytonema hofmanni] UTEX B 1581]
MKFLADMGISLVIAFFVKVQCLRSRSDSKGVSHTINTIFD